MRSTSSVKQFNNVIKNMSIKSINEGYSNYANQHQYASLNNINDETANEQKPRNNNKMVTLTAFNRFDVIEEEDMETHSKSPRPISLKNRKNTNIGTITPKNNLKGGTTARQNIGSNKPTAKNNMKKIKIEEKMH